MGRGGSGEGGKGDAKGDGEKGIGSVASVGEKERVYWGVAGKERKVV